MRFPLISTALAALCFALPTAAQKVNNYGGDGTVASSTMLLFTESFECKAAVVINHGQPEWKDDYTQMLDKLKGRLNRLGKNMWTTFMSSAPIEIGGTIVPAGSYVAGLMCDKDGKFSLALLDAGKAMKQGLMPFGPQTWKPDVLVPMELHRDSSKESVTLMKISLATEKDDPMHGTLTIAWGPHTLTAKLAVHEHGKDDHGEHDKEHGEHKK